MTNTKKKTVSKLKNHINKKLVYGVGINDADYVVQPTVDGKQLVCPYYQTWTNVLMRCHDPKFHVKRPTYIGCTVDPVWLSFMAFKQWMEQQQWEGMQLDKDIIEPNNKVYSPDTCVFVSQRINLLLNDHAAKRGQYPQGVYWNRRDNKFYAQCNDVKKRKHLGSFDTPEAAYATYVEYKSALITTIAYEQTDPRIKDGLLQHAKLLTETL